MCKNNEEVPSMEIKLCFLLDQAICHILQSKAPTHKKDAVILPFIQAALQLPYLSHSIIVNTYYNSNSLSVNKL